MNFEGIFRPDYAQRGLNRVLPAIAAKLGHPDADDTLGLPEASRFLVLLVDGLGWHQLQIHKGVAGRLDDLAAGSSPISCGVPSTTAASLTSLGTGQPSGQHGVVGYRFRNPENGKCMNSLSWANGPADVLGFQPVPTWYQQLSEFGTTSGNVSIDRFAESALTQCAMRGAHFHGYAQENEADLAAKVELAVQAISAAPVVYLYERLLDSVGHAHGAGSWQWTEQLAQVDDLVVLLRDALPDDVCLLVTGDHGMVNVDPEQTVIVEDYPELKGWDIFAGEARFRHLYTSEPLELRRRLASFLGERAWVFTRDEGIDAGLFGEIRPGVEPRLGDVMVAMRDRWVLLTRAYPVELGMLGVHGSLTPDEMQVPLLIDGPVGG